MKTELSKLIDKWEIEKGSYIPNAPIYQAFIDEAKEALDRESKVNNIVLNNVSNRRELLIDFAEKVYRRVFFTWDKKTSEKVVDEYIKGNL
tara:strand:- start:61 stop:333 length:273 start_codon:yes stop_codon:yes gene_type:complete